MRRMTHFAAMMLVLMFVSTAFAQAPPLVAQMRADSETAQGISATERATVLAARIAIGQFEVGTNPNGWDGAMGDVIDRYDEFEFELDIIDDALTAAEADIGDAKTRHVNGKIDDDLGIADNEAGDIQWGLGNWALAHELYFDSITDFNRSSVDFAWAAVHLVSGNANITRANEIMDAYPAKATMEEAEEEAAQAKNDAGNAYLLADEALDDAQDYFDGAYSTTFPNDEAEMGDQLGELVTGFNVGATLADDTEFGAFKDGNFHRIDGDAHWNYALTGVPGSVDHFDLAAIDYNLAIADYNTATADFITARNIFELIEEEAEALLSTMQSLVEDAKNAADLSKADAEGLQLEADDTLVDQIVAHAAAIANYALHNGYYQTTFIPAHGTDGDVEYLLDEADDLIDAAPAFVTQGDTFMSDGDADIATGNTAYAAGDYVAAADAYDDAEAHYSDALEQYEFALYSDEDSWYASEDAKDLMTEIEECGCE